MSQAAVKDSHPATRTASRSRCSGIPVPTNFLVEVIDQLDDSGFSLSIAGHLALDAFRHPYAYAQLHEDHTDRAPRSTVGE